MKRVEAIIRPHKQAIVLAALAKSGITNVTVFDTLGLARQVSQSRIFEPSSQDKETRTGLIPKRMLILFVDDNQLQSVLNIVQQTAFTGDPGDGIIAVSDLTQVIHIRSAAKPGGA